MFDPSRPLTDEFEPADIGLWREKATADLKGRPLEKLTGHTDDGLEIRPLYTRDEQVAPTMIGLPGAPPFRRGTRPLGRSLEGPDVRSVVENADPERAKEQLREDLHRGATSVLLRIATRTAHGWTPGVRLASAAQLKGLLDGVDPIAAPVHLDAGGAGIEFAQAWVELLEERGLHPAAVRGGLGIDPIGTLAREGEVPASVEAVLSRGAALTHDVEAMPNLRVFSVDPDFVHHAGATTAQTLAVALATGAAYLRALDAAGVDPDHGTGRIAFAWRADTHFFEQIAALRALRITWNRIAEASGSSGRSMHVHVLTSERVVSRRDPWVNVLRGTATTFAGMIGGADAVSCASFDRALGQSAPMGRRIARNTPIILGEESHLHRVVDPAGGSWFLENLTAELALKAWDEFQEIEREGGVIEALRSGWLRERVDAAWERKRAKIATRREALTGVSEFAQLDERRPDVEPFPDPGEGVQAESERLQPWPVRRLGDDFEELRDASDAANAEGREPRAFLVTLGPLAEHNLRANWIRNVLAAGGIASRDAGDLEDADAAAKAFAESGLDFAVICGTDARYAEQAADVARALRREGVPLVWLAGRPGDHEDAWRSAGVDRFVHMGVDVIEVLREALGHLIESTREETER
ncbi:MAG TPA: methylmalonyl-CoA mutase family protein [Candidatus Krumholzibacteria bacterium]|nr:methylmalonyl-CoA mutase family protein [Candidatus Krumholzibacteria bacterium]